MLIQNLETYLILIIEFYIVQESSVKIVFEIALADPHLQHNDRFQNLS